MDAWARASWQGCRKERGVGEDTWRALKLSMKVRGRQAEGAGSLDRENGHKAVDKEWPWFVPRLLGIMRKRLGREARLRSQAF